MTAKCQPTSFIKKQKREKHKRMDHDHGMPGMTNHTAGPGPEPMIVPRRRMMMHMTFYWGKEALILFTGWPGTSTGMYVLALVFVFLLCFIVEWISHCQVIKSDSSHVAAGLVQTLLHTLRMGLAYMAMLAVMSFNGGVLLAAVAGHALGFMVFGSRVFKKNPPPPTKPSDLPPMSC